MNENETTAAPLAQENTENINPENTKTAEPEKEYIGKVEWKSISDEEWEDAENSYDHIEDGKTRNDIIFWNLGDPDYDDTNPEEMIIFGTGRMKDYNSGSLGDAPWNEAVKSVKVLTIEEGITELGVNAFRNAEKLECVFLPASLKHIHLGCFSGCTSLKEIYFAPGTQLCSLYEKELPGASSAMSRNKNNQVCFGIHAFRGTPWAAEKWGDAYISRGVLLDYNGSSDSYTIPDEVHTIGRMAFSGCGMRRVVFPQGLKTVLSLAFDTNDLSSVDLPDTVTEIGSGAFQNNPGLTKVVVRTPSGLEIKKNAFANTPCEIPVERVQKEFVFIEADESAPSKSRRKAAKKLPEIPEDIIAEIPSGSKIISRQLTYGNGFCELVFRPTPLAFSTVCFDTSKYIYDKLRRAGAIIQIVRSRASRAVTAIYIYRYTSDIRSYSRTELLSGEEMVFGGPDPSRRKTKTADTEKEISTYISYEDSPAGKLFAADSNECMKSHTINDTIEGVLPAGTDPGDTEQFWYQMTHRYDEAQLEGFISWWKSNNK